MEKLVLIRHGQSQWNLENRFTGWTDVKLTDQGYQEAHRAGQLLQQNGYVFDQAFTSVLTRAIDTLPRGAGGNRRPLDTRAEVVAAQ